jgi:hypothetical protein
MPKDRTAVKVIRSIFIEDSEIKREAFYDIGVSYPFLQSSKTAGDLFITAFAHMMRNYKVDTVIGGTTGEYEEADKIVDKACLLADSVLT